MIRMTIITTLTLMTVLTVCHANPAGLDIAEATSAGKPGKYQLAGGESRSSAKVAESETRKIIDEFADTVKGVIPSQINSDKQGSDPELQLWTKGTQDVLSYLNFGTSTYTRNNANALQAAGVNLSGISAPSWIHSLNQQQLTATAISPLHIISAAHWHPVVGQTIYFVDASNHSIPRLIESAQQIIDPNGGTTDLWVAKLASELPESITPFKVLPKNYKAILAEISSGIPTWICQGGTTTISALWVATDANDQAAYLPNPSRGFDLNFIKHSGAYAGWNPVIHGGSGSPVFVVINHQPVLISILHYMRGVEFLGGPSVTDLSGPINAAMAALQGGSSPYQLTPVALKP